MARFTFEMEAQDDRARAIRLLFPGDMKLETPVFMPVGTQASVKSLLQEDLEEIGYWLILTNTYHLHLRPGTTVLNHFGGAKKFMSWPRLMLTDSGGYQAFSLSSLVKYDEYGIHFRSHLDGSPHLFTPSGTLDIQRAIGSDIMMPLDDCAPYPADRKRLAESLQRTTRWLQESKKHWLDTGQDQTQSLFGIVQGGVETDLREESAKALTALDLPGYAIGGLSVGEKDAEFRKALEHTLKFLPENKPRYLMGVGSLPEIIYAVEYGVDMFDCVLPTRNARNGQVFTSGGKLNLRAEYNKLKDAPIDPECQCRVCRRYSLGYIRHLHKAREISAYSLSSYHNLFFMKRFMDELRNSILQKSFADFKAHWISLYT